MRDPSPGLLASALRGGLANISQNATVTFTRYVKLVLPLDGFVFWVKADLVGPGAAMNSSPLGSFAINEDPAILNPANTITAEGSLHYSASKTQEAENAATVNRVMFNTPVCLHEGIDDDPSSIYIGEVDGLRFTFSSFENYYKQADIWHYIGDAIYSNFQSQIIDDAASFDSRSIVASSSMPFWLFLNNYTPTRPAYGFGCPVKLFPAFLVPGNTAPPYGTVEISDTAATAGFRHLTRLSSHHQLASEKVTVTLYGLRNNSAMDFLDCVLQRSRDYNDVGIINCPIVKEEKENQVELGVLAMRKTIVFEVSYYQQSMRDIARQLILNTIPTVRFSTPARLTNLTS